MNKVLALEVDHFLNNRVKKRKITNKNDHSHNFYSNNKKIENNFVQTRYPKIKPKNIQNEDNILFEPWNQEKDDPEQLFFFWLKLIYHRIFSSYNRNIWDNKLIKYQERMDPCMKVNAIGLVNIMEKEDSNM